MKITCQACEAKYTIADEKVQGKVAKIRCKKCGATIVVNGTGSGDAAAGESAPEAGMYTVAVTDDDQRTMSLQELVDAYNAGTVNGETFIWGDGMSEWTSLEKVPAVVDALHAAAGGEAPAEPAPAPAAAARREGSRQKSFDLFGGADKAGAEEEAPGSGRKSTPSHTGGGGSGSAMTGARGEQSVLFSLNALAGADRKSSPPKGGDSKTKEDSGLIDLGALAKQADAAPAAPMFSAPMLGVAPILGAPVLETPAVAAPAPPPEKKGNGALFAVVGLLGAGIIAGAIVFTRPKDPPPAIPAVAPSATDTAPPAPTATSTAVDPSAATTASGAASAAAATTKKVVGGPLPKGGNPPGGTTTTAPPKTNDPVKPPPPAAGKCGCPPGDLNCAIKCASKH